MLLNNFPVGKIHMVGIAGIGMSGIAEILYELGYHVQGSDLLLNNNVTRLRQKGIQVVLNHDTSNVDPSVSVVVYSSAVGEDNCELVAAREHKISIIKRTDMLAELMRLKPTVVVAGSHGKTTTTSLTGAIMESNSYDPTIINGGVIQSYGSNAKLGSGQWMIVESDESDGSFVDLPAIIAIVTNVDSEHLNFYGSFEKLKLAFVKLLKKLPFYGFAVTCCDDPVLQSIVADIKQRNIITYGFTKDADVQAINVRYKDEKMYFSVKLSSHFSQVLQNLQHDEPKNINVALNMLGEHNVLNALAAITVNLLVGASDIAEALEGFAGVNRRFTTVGNYKGVRLIDDYAHHPTEINQTLKAAKYTCRGKLIAIIQPHRYSRLSGLLEEFATTLMLADYVLVTPVYTAGEKAIDVDHMDLLKLLQFKGHEQVYCITDSEDAATFLAKHATEQDIAIFLGAGSITLWPRVIAAKDA